MLRLLSERGLMASVDASSIRTIICAGSKLDARTLDAARRWAPNATIFEYYGAAELSFVSGRGFAAGEPLDAAGTAIGGPFPGVEVQILDDHGRSLPDGTPGNISVKSPMVCQGYLWGDDGKALRCLDGHFTVGDQGYLQDGDLHILGRSSDMINTAGQNVYPHEIELALSSIPGVETALAVGTPDDLRGHRVVAGIVPSCGGLTATSLTRGLSGPKQGKRPLHYYSLSDLPPDRSRKSGPPDVSGMDQQQRCTTESPALDTENRVAHGRHPADANGSLPKLAQGWRNTGPRSSLSVRSVSGPQSMSAAHMHTTHFNLQRRAHDHPVRGQTRHGYVALEDHAR